MAIQLMKIVVSLIFALWVAILAHRMLNGDDDDWPRGGAAA